MKSRLRAMKHADLERLVERALAGLDLSARVAVALPVASHALPARVIAIGKAAPAMAAGAVARWGDVIERLLVVMPDGTDTSSLRAAVQKANVADRLAVMPAGHPLPDARSVKAAAACLAAVHSDAPRRIVVLMSGGASALVCAPAPGLTLATKRAVTRTMLDSGASVQEVNVVRKHLSRIKGGGLVRAAAPNDVLTVVASDVIGGAPADVGSGPSLPDPSTVADARRLLRRFAPAFADAPIARTFSPSVAGAARARAKVVLAPEDLARLVAKLLRDQGVLTRVLPSSQASAEDLAAEYVALARDARSPSGPRAFVRAAEPAVMVPARAGRGGRSSHVAALVGRALADEEGALFGAFATDGVDGKSGTGGAVVDAHFAARAVARLGETGLDRAIARFDTGTVHRAVESAVASRPSGYNLADLHVLVVA